MIRQSQINIEIPQFFIMTNTLKISKSFIIYFLLIFVPISVILDLVHADPIIIFIISVIALIPLAKLIGDSTEHLATHYGSTLGSLLNVTFGNAAEIIIAVVAINAGLLELVKASITGAILGNIMLIFGLSMIASGIRQKEQLFSRENAGLQSTMIFLAIIGLAIPTILSSTILNPTEFENQLKIQFLSDALAVLLLSVYIAGIVFTFFTHKYLFVSSNIEPENNSHVFNNNKHWDKKKAFLMLAISMVGVVVISEILVGSVEETSKHLGFGELFVGAIIIGIVGNAAEHSSAIILARKGKIDLSIGIAAGSGTQIALFVVPILVIFGIILNQPFTLEFTIYELVTLFLAAIILNLIAHDGKSNWFEGIMLTAVYIIIAIGFYFMG
ncbi:MAG TPA: calcium/proton exchanger [Nitrososphaeraceae archaeon]|nr:calcium/proton exchanger [Nitrososphaeraceae archaeon]